MRTTKILIDDVWTDCEFADIEKDDIFQLFNDGKIVITSTGKSTMKAASGVYLKNDELTIDIY